MCTKSTSTAHDGTSIPRELANDMCSGGQAIMHAPGMADDSRRHDKEAALELDWLERGVIRSTPVWIPYHNRLLLECNTDWCDVLM